ncbi:MAG: YhcH/YjgK/YiaL family protein [Succinivibrionaceae bacterium]|nr:YhcH/YjgK/YiaL family protein [Succinivibrionaceae bacterium]
MIVTDIATAGGFSARLGDVISKALAVAAKQSIGKYPIEGDDITVTVSEDLLENAAERRLEVHREYADIQIVLEGRERYGYIPGSCRKEYETDRLDTDDIAFLKLSEECQYADLAPKQLAVFFPGAAHKPLCIPPTGETRVKKAIIKIRKNRLKDLFSLQ